MGRVPKPSAPQRVSAHVVQKAPAVPAAPAAPANSAAPSDDEDEKTTIESGGWEDEPSTTVEQGEVADKLRAFVNRPVTSLTSLGTSTGTSVDDVARLVITQGNDAGQTLDVRPGKAYTIGRAIDNDLVLTDITVSRKHFDVRADHGAWVLADRGSGNGTLINNRIEDAPFLLANGDVIEIGNTTFRFDLPNGAPRAAPSADEDELSTVSSKPPVRSTALTPGQLITPVVPTPVVPTRQPTLLASPPGLPPAPIPPPGPTAPLVRPKTLPPPAPRQRARTQSNRPAFALESPHEMPRPQLPPPARPPTQPPPLPARGAAMPVSLQTTQPLLGRGPVLGTQPMAAQLPGQALPLPQMASRPPAAFSDAPTSTIPGQGPPLPPPHLAALGHPVHPTRMPFSYPVAPPGPLSGTMNIPLHGMLDPSRSPAPNLAGRPGVRDATSTALVQPISYASNGTGPAAAIQDRPSPVVRRLKMAIGGAALAAAAAAITIAVIKLAGGDSHAVEAEVAMQAPPPPALVVKPTPTVEPIQPTPTPAPVVKAAPPPPVIKPAPPPAPTQVAAKEPAPSPPTPAVKKPPERPVERPAPIERPPERRVVAAVAAPHTDEPPRPRHTGKALQDIKNEASALYRNKNFAGASSLLQSSLANFTGGDAQDLKSLAAIYSQLGKAYNVGMAPGTKATEAYTALRHALDFDRSLGGAFSAELKEHLVAAATRAASSFMAAKDYESAFQAVRVAESLGSTSSNNKIVRSMLEGIANDLYRDAAQSKDSDPEGAKRKARQVLGIIDPSNPLHDKAQRLSASL
jgi:pSer/pThr/pTyr-binding forkhead associated (FHA) protein/outer membrane biosynthesis protein TonB